MFKPSGVHDLSCEFCELSREPELIQYVVILVLKNILIFIFLIQDTFLSVIQVIFEPMLSTGSPRINLHAG